MKVAIVTLGCRVNQSESAVIEETLKENGVTIVTLKDKPDVCIVNTCTVTKKSDINSRQLIGKAARSGARVLVTGCYAQMNSQEANGLVGVAGVIDNDHKLDIINMITESAAEPAYHSSSRSRPYVKVQDGCNFNCSYCAVPLARGRSRSVPEKLLVERVNAICARGYKEIVLTGIHLGTYGQDFQEKGSIAGIAGLVGALLKKTSIHRIRLSSLEISEIGDELLELLSDERICRNLHIPLQSGSDKILGLMRRRYKAGYFRERIETILTRLGDIAIGTDVIAGFPGEGEPEFKETLELLRALPFAYLHVFPYSPRPDTDALRIPGRPSLEAARMRADQLLQLGRQKKTRYMQTQIGKSFEIVVEEGLHNGMTVGTSSNYLKIAVPGYGNRAGSVAIAKAVRVKNGMLEGVRIKEA